MENNSLDKKNITMEVKFNSFNKLLKILFFF